MDEANQAKVIKEIEEEEKKNATEVTNKQGTSKKIIKNDKEELRKRNVLKPINYSYFINQIVRSSCFLSRGLFPAPWCETSKVLTQASLSAICWF